MSRKNESPLPKGWLEGYLGKADLEFSFLRLRGCKHFHADTMRGRIRSLQFRTEEAWKHFRQAEKQSKKAEETIPNLLHLFVRQAYKFDNALLEGPIDPKAEFPEPWLPELPREILRAYPEVRLALDLRKQVEAVLKLHLGDWEDAAGFYKELIEKSVEALRNELPFYFMGLGCCEQNMGRETLARRALENAELALQASKWVFYRAYGAGVLLALYKVLEMKKKATEWGEFLERLSCPKATKDIFRKRGEIIRARCIEQSSLVLL